MKYKAAASLFVLVFATASYARPQDDAFIKRVQAVGMCAAGGGGSTAGSQEHGNVYLTAPTAFYLDPSSLRLVKREQPAGWKYGLARDPTFTWSRIPADAQFPNTMIGTPSSCDGQNGDTQGRIDFTFEVKTYPRKE